MDQLDPMVILHELFDPSLPRLGPGDDDCTRRALAELKLSPPRRVLDLGCGNGAPTLVLARELAGPILAVDNHEPYLAELRRRAVAAGVGDKIETRCRDMRELGPDAGPFDLIWSEGALFVMGFRNALAACRQLLAPGGKMAVTELCWLAPEPPDECRRFFGEHYPDLATVDEDLAAMRACGYEITGHFPLPESAWSENYYPPIEARLPAFRERHAGDGDHLAFADSVQAEIDLYRRYSRYYGYEFFLMRRGSAG
jgi:SAM-dependent methyltransferase